MTLVAGPTRLEPPTVDEVVRVRSAAEMHEAIMAAAAVRRRCHHGRRRCRLHARGAVTGEVAKTDGPLTLTLNRTRDILAISAPAGPLQSGRRPVLVGFAAETDDLLRRRARSARARAST